MTTDPPSSVDPPTGAGAGVGVSGEGDEAGYRQLSTAAVVALVLGLASPLVLLGSVFVVAPLVAIAVGLVAVRSIAARPEALSGRPLALWGIGLAAGFLAFSAGNAQVVGWLLARQARPTAEAWLAAVRDGDVIRAGDLTVPSQARPPGPDGSQPGPPPLAERFFAVQDLLDLSDWTGERFEDATRTRGGGASYWTIDLAYRLQRSGSEPPLRLVLRLARRRGAESASAAWMVTSVGRPAPVNDR
ncbi:MAG: hypothetical protein AAF596_01075 [Planctomycetota bacterium]